MSSLTSPNAGSGQKRGRGSTVLPASALGGTGYTDQDFADQIKALKALITSQNHRIEWLEGKAGRVDELASTIVQLEASVRAVAFNQKLVKWGGVSDAEQMADAKLAALIVIMFNEGTSLASTPKEVKLEIPKIDVDGLPDGFPGSTKIFIDGLKNKKLKIPECCSRSNVLQLDAMRRATKAIIQESITNPPEDNTIYPNLTQLHNVYGSDGSTPSQPLTTAICQQWCKLDKELKTFCGAFCEKSAFAPIISDYSVLASTTFKLSVISYIVFKGADVMFLTDMHTRLTGQATVVDAVAGDHGASGCASGSDSQSSVATDLQDQDC